MLILTYYLDRLGEVTQNHGIFVLQYIMNQHERLTSESSIVNRRGGCLLKQIGEAFQSIPTDLVWLVQERRKDIVRESNACLRMGTFSQEIENGRLTRAQVAEQINKITHEDPDQGVILDTLFMFSPKQDS